LGLQKRLGCTDNYFLGSESDFMTVPTKFLKKKIHGFDIVGNVKIKLEWLDSGHGVGQFVAEESYTSDLPSALTMRLQKETY
jgi:hypothetical protein